MRKKVLYISTSLFPYGQAYSTRLSNFARLFNELNYDIHIISDFTYEKFTDSKTTKSFQSCTYQIVAGAPTSLNRIKSTFESIQLIKEYMKNNNVDFVIIGNCYDRFKRVENLCRLYEVPLILEICEWYDTTTRKFGNMNPYNALYNWRMENDYKRADGFITISRYLNDYFKHYSDNVIRIPTILDPENTTHSFVSKNEKINLVHLGLSGVHKEKFKNILLALKLLGEDRRKFEYNIYGSDRTTVLKNIDNDEELLNSLSDCVKIHGRIPQREVHNVYLNADFSIFIRPKKRSSDAGFPTKLAESMIAGTPVITNNTGDISLYLNNNVEGFLLDSDTPECLSNLFMRVIGMSINEKQEMRKKCYDAAAEAFNYKSYIEDLSRFLDDVLEYKNNKLSSGE